VTSGKALRLAGGAFVALFLAMSGWFVLRGPQSLPALLEKWRRIQQLEEQNATRDQQNQVLRERLKRLEDSPSEQEMEIRKQLKLLRPGETTFILPEAPREADPK
jgi:cell division protein FtsB